VYVKCEFLFFTQRTASFLHILLIVLQIMMFVGSAVAVRGGADKSVARPTSQCCMTESIVSLERGVCSCAEMHVFSSYRGSKGSMSSDPHNLKNMEMWAVIKFFFPARQGAEGGSRHSERNITGTCTIVCHHQKLGGPVSTWWIFPPVMRLVLDEPKQWPSWKLFIKFMS